MQLSPRTYSGSMLILVLFLIVFQTLVVVLGDITREPWGDEHHFVQTVRTFAGEPFAETLRTYPEMSGPLPFIIYAAWGRVVGLDLWQLRLLSLLIALASCLLFHRLLFNTTGSGLAAALLSIFLALHPYMVGFSLFVFTDGPAIFFTILTVHAVTRNSPALIFLGLCGALLSRQYLIFLWLAVILYYVWQALSLPNRRTAITNCTITAATLVPLISLFMYWNGLSPDNDLRTLYADQTLTFHSSYLVMYISIMFWYLLPLLIYRFRGIYYAPGAIVSALSLSWIYFLIPVRPSAYAVDIDVHTVGLFHKAVLRLHDAVWFADLIFLLGFALGLPLLLYIVRNITHSLRTGRPTLPTLLDMAALAFLLIMPFSYLNWEKYLMPLLPLLILRFAMTPASRTEVPPPSAPPGRK